MSNRCRSFSYNAGLGRDHHGESPEISNLAALAFYRHGAHAYYVRQLLIENIAGDKHLMKISQLSCIYKHLSNDEISFHWPAGMPMGGIELAEDADVSVSSIGNAIYL